MKTNLALICSMGAILSSPAADFWLSPKQDETNHFGTATYGNLGGGGMAGRAPDSAYYGDFDTIIASLPSGTNTIRLLPGIFLTKGDTNHLATKWKADTRLMGSGIGVTTIRAKEFPLLSRTSAIRVVQTNSNFHVSDLTVEFEYGTSMPGQGTMGLALFGDHSQVARVVVRSIFGSFKLGAANGEGFGVVIGNNINSTGGLVEDSSVLDSVGDYVSAIVTSGEASMIGNHVEFPLSTPPGYDHFKFHGYCPADATNTTIAGNYQYGGLAGVWQDTGSSRNLVISGNHFKRTRTSVLFIVSSRNSQLMNIWVTNNRFEMPSPGSGVTVLAGSPARMDRLTISHNTFLPYGGFTTTTNGYSVVLGHPRVAGPGAIFDTSIFGNMVPPPATYSIWTTGMVNVHDNTDHSGRSLASAWNEKNQTAALPMSKYTVGHDASTFQLEKEQAFVVVAGTTPVTNNTIVLPEAGAVGGWTYPGREVVIVNTASQPVLVRTYSDAEKINDGGTDKREISLEVDRLIRLLSVDNHKWYLSK